MQEFYSFVLNRSDSRRGSGMYLNAYDSACTWAQDAGFVLSATGSGCPCFIKPDGTLHSGPIQPGGAGIHADGDEQDEEDEWRSLNNDKGKCEMAALEALGFDMDLDGRTEQGNYRDTVYLTKAAVKEIFSLDLPVNKCDYLSDAVWGPDGAVLKQARQCSPEKLRDALICTRQDVTLDLTKNGHRNLTCHQQCESQEERKHTVGLIVAVELRRTPREPKECTHKGSWQEKLSCRNRRCSHWTAWQKMKACETAIECLVRTAAAPRNLRPSSASSQHEQLRASSHHHHSNRGG